MQNREEVFGEYVEALMTCDNLLCLYGGVITIVENSEPKEEMITEEIPEGEEEGRTEFFVEDNWLKLYLSPTVSEKGRSVPKHPDANNYDWAMPEELNNKKTDWLKTSSPAHDYSYFAY